MKTKPKHFLFIVFQLISVVSFSQVWDFVYDSIPSMGRQVILTRDSCYLATAVNNSFEDDNLSIKLDQYGNIIWMSSNGGYSVAQTYDNKFVIAASNFPNAVLKKIDENGNLEWYKTYGDGKQEDFSTVIQSSDSCLVACGYTNNHGDSTFLAIKTDSQGNLIWSTCFFSMDHHGFSEIIEFDHHYYVVGHECDESAEPFYLFIVKLTMSGIPRWQKLYEMGFTGSAIAATHDSALIVAGGQWLTKLNTDGDTIWAKKLYPSWRIYSVDITPENGYIVSGTNELYEPVNLLAELDSEGEKIWSHTYPTVSDPYWGGFESVKCAVDGGFITCGYSLYNSRDVTRFRVLKTDATGGILVGISTKNEIKPNLIYPNPIEGKFVIDIEGINNVEVFDGNGRFINSFGNKSEIDLSYCESGIYIIRIATDQGFFFQKIIKK